MRHHGGYGVTVECGQHDDPNAPGVAYAAIINALKFLGMIEPRVSQPVRIKRSLRLKEVYLRVEEGSWLRWSQNVVSIRPLVVSGRVVSRLIKSGPIKAGEVAFVASSCVPSSRGISRPARGHRVVPFFRCARAPPARQAERLPHVQSYAGDWVTRSGIPDDTAEHR
jgi:hypothetical protein